MTIIPPCSPCFASLEISREYNIVFGGAYSTYYWQGCSWNVLIYNPFEQNESYIKPRFVYYKHMKDFFTKHDLSTLKPEPDRNGSEYCLSDSNEKYLFYVPKENYMIQPSFLKKPLITGLTHGSIH